jgi:uncharacterized protein (DUF362 family)
MRNDVFVARVDPVYPRFPYEEKGGLYEGLRTLFSLWGKNPDNPFKEVIGPNGRVLLKPNWVHDSNSRGYSLDSLVTNTAVIKYLIDWVALALDGVGTIIVGDAPIQGCDFQNLMERSRINATLQLVKEKYPRINFILEDWRLTIANGSTEVVDDLSAQTPADVSPGKLASMSRYEEIDLGKDSFLEDISDYADRFRVTCYKPSTMLPRHRPGKHEYLVTKRVFDVDLLINLPKMKTHIKAGLSGALKNIIGINGHKEYLPHHIQGSYSEGGDCYYNGNRLRSLHDSFYDSFWEHHSRLSAMRRKLGLRLIGGLWRASRLVGGDAISAGSWDGNETVWRTTLDLNHVLYFNPRSPRHIISVVDGVIAGEADGPLTPSPKAAGVLLGGENPAYVDAAMAQLMGYNISRVPTVYQSIYHRKSQFAGPFLEDVKVAYSSGCKGSNNVFLSDLPNLQFIKPRHWLRAESPFDRERLLDSHQAA